MLQTYGLWSLTTGKISLSTCGTKCLKILFRQTREKGKILVLIVRLHGDGRRGFEGFAPHDFNRTPTGPRHVRAPI